MSSDYVEAAPRNPPQITRRKWLALGLSSLAIAVGVACLVALTVSNVELKNQSEVQVVDSSRSFAEGRPEGTPFVHKPQCPYMQFCKDSYLFSDATTKQRALMLEARGDTSSGPEAGATDLIGLLDPAGFLDPDLNPLLYWMESAAIWVGTSILNAFAKGTDVRTTFGIGLDWQQLRHAYTTGDQMEPGRAKAIHAVGVVGAVTLDTTGAPAHPYTGMLASGFDGVVRFSSAVPIARGKAAKEYWFIGKEKVSKPCVVAPGLGLKALVSGKESADLVAMWHLDGQPGEWNFFAHEFSTVVPGSGQTALKALAKQFEDASDCPSHVGISAFADHSADGSAVSVPRHPYSLVFVPDAALKARFDAMVKDGFDEIHSCEKASQCPDVFDSLSALPAGQALYKVYAVADPAVKAWSGEIGRKEKFNPNAAPDRIHFIGTLRLSSVLSPNGDALKPMQRSKFGDTGLFFRHRLLEDSILNALCLHDQNWLPSLRMSSTLLDRNQPTCGIGGKDNDGSDTPSRKSMTCRLLFRAKAIYPDCFNKVIDTWNAGAFFPFPRKFEKVTAANWQDWCGADRRPVNAESRDMVLQSFS